jgi:tRNA/rRNA methyltransferase
MSEQNRESTSKAWSIPLFCGKVPSVIHDLKGSPAMNIPSLSDVTVILVEPQSPGNIGMVCRAMANFGAADLRLVNPCHHLHPEARKFAVGASSLLGSASIFPDLPSAVSDLHMTVATTRRRGRLRGQLLDISAVPALRSELPPAARMGLVFGREDAGLTSEETALCSHAATVNTSAEIGSLNLAQAVLLFLYELARQPVTTSHMREIAEQGEVEPLFEQMESVLTRIAFLNSKRPDRVMTPLRHILRRAELNRHEVRLLRGMWSQLAWSIRDWRGRKRGED